jgi:hypothetical protein
MEKVEKGARSPRRRLVRRFEHAVIVRWRGVIVRWHAVTVRWHAVIVC